jgi:hypothetical protein
LDPSAAPPSDPAEPVLSGYCRLRDVLRSWFWRYYDHLGHLLVYNLAWFLTCLIVAWFPFHSGLIGHGSSFTVQDYLLFWALYLLECAVSVGWAHLVFKTFIQGEGSLADVPGGFRHYFWKAMGLSIVSSLILGTGFYNLRFYFLLNGPHRLGSYLLLGVVFWILLFWSSSMLYQWPVLFFQNPPFFKILYRSSLLVLSDGLRSFAVLALFALCFLCFWWAPFLWIFIGPVSFFSFQSVMLEKQYLRYKITYKERPVPQVLEQLDKERQRGWRDFLRPWETR